MYGCFLVPPDDDGADLGVLFWHKDGYSTACGHGTIALGAWAVESGARRRAARTARSRSRSTCRPAASSRACARAAGPSRRVAFRNVPSYVVARDVAGGRRRRSTSPTAARSTRRSPRGASGCASRPTTCRELIAAGREVKAALEGTEVARTRPTSGCRASTGRSSTRSSAPLHQRNVTIFADGEVDRSPCGSGTSARLRAARPRTGPWARATSCATTRSSARRSSPASSARPADGVLTEVEGTAYRTGEHRFVLDPRDPLGTGFVLR